MMKALYHFFTDPVDESPDTPSLADSSTPAGEFSPDMDAGDGEPEFDDDLIISDREKLSEDESQSRLRLDEAYWPYAFTPDEGGDFIGTDEVLKDGFDEEGDGEKYAGQWVREMFEGHDLRDDENTWLGYTKDNVRGVREAGIEYNALFRHMAFFGTTGYGKSTVLLNLMVQWAFMDHGFCFIDPKGQDILELVQMLPEDRLDDVVWVEPGNEESDYSVGFNFFDTARSPGEPGHGNEVQEIVSDIVALLKAGVPGWGATMDSVSKAVATQLIRTDEDYTLVDMYKILSEEEERQAFADHFGVDEIERIYLDRLAEMDTEEVDPLMRRFREWADTPTSREIVAQRESTVNISKLVEDGKIILVRPSRVPDDIKSLVATSIVRRIWATIRARADDAETDELDPYFVVMDEFDLLADKSEMKIGDILSKGRSLRVAVCVATQQPHLLPDEVYEDFSNVENLFTFNPGQNMNDVKQLGETFAVENQFDLMNLERYELLGRFMVGNKKTDAIPVTTFAPYPPRRTPAVAEAVRDRSVERYGTKRKDDEQQRWGLLYRLEGHDDVETIEITDDEHISIPQVLESVHTAGVRHGTRVINEKSHWVSIEGVRAEVSKYSEAVENGAVLDNALEKIPNTLLEEATVGEDTYYRLTTEGEQEAFVQDSGRSASGGKAGHRHLLKKAYEAFTRLGYDVKIPTQEGDEQCDGVCVPPIVPMEEANDLAEAKRLEAKLKRDYARLYDLFGDSELSLEAESTTIEKPKQTIKNLSKAVDAGRPCIFLVKDGTESKGSFEYWARAGENILTDPPFVSSKDARGNRHFYNLTTPVKLKDAESNCYALRKSHGSDIIWRDTGNTIILENPKNRLIHNATEVRYSYSYLADDSIVLSGPDGDPYTDESGEVHHYSDWGEIIGINGEFSETHEPLAIFDEPTDLDEPHRSKFQFNYFYDQSNREYVVRDKNGHELERFDEREDMLDGYDLVYAPLIPELLFPDGDYPSPDDWLFVIIPDDTNDIGPHIYKNGEMEPLFYNDDPYNAIADQSLPNPDEAEATEADTISTADTTDEDESTDDTDETNVSGGDEHERDRSDADSDTIPAEATEGEDDDGDEQADDGDEVEDQPDDGRDDLADAGNNEAEEDDDDGRSNNEDESEADDLGNDPENDDDAHESEAEATDADEDASEDDADDAESTSEPADDDSGPASKRASERYSHRTKTSEFVSLIETGPSDEGETPDQSDENDETDAADATSDAEADDDEDTNSAGAGAGGDDDVPISSDTPASTNEVVKRSGEIWTKPESGDDDYVPAKDNQNYRAGYREDGVGDDWTGGQAREDDLHGDFDSYVPPDERRAREEDARLREAYARSLTDATESIDEEETLDEEDSTASVDDGETNTDQSEDRADAEPPAPADPQPNTGADSHAFHPRPRVHHRTTDTDEAVNDTESGTKQTEDEDESR